MNKQIAAVVAIFVVFAAGMGVGYSAKLGPSPALYQGKDARDAGQALLSVALAQAGKGSWERIGVARVYYLGGFKEQGRQIFDSVLAGKPDDGDVYRIARVYQEAGEWDKAQAMFTKFLAANRDEAKDLAEVGAYAYLHGDRTRAEQLFDQSFAASNDEVWATLMAAGAYLGVKPQL